MAKRLGRRVTKFTDGMHLEDIPKLSRIRTVKKAKYEIVFAMVASSFFVKRVIKKIKELRK